MRYNSLRSQLNWHSRQQTHHFKKLGRTPAEREAASALDPSPNDEDPQLRGHELIWLERMMKELHQYKEEATDGRQRPEREREAERVDVIVKEKCGNEYRPARSGPDRQQKAVASMEDSAKSAKKIKFEVVLHPEKPQSAKKTTVSEPKCKPKSVKKTPSKAPPKKSLPEKQSASKDPPNSGKDASLGKDIQICPSNTKVIEIE
jgi:hypothetical protein